MSEDRPERPCARTSTQRMVWAAMGCALGGSLGALSGWLHAPTEGSATSAFWGAAFWGSTFGGSTILLALLWVATGGWLASGRVRPREKPAGPTTPPGGAPPTSTARASDERTGAFLRCASEIDEQVRRFRLQTDRLEEEASDPESVELLRLSAQRVAEAAAALREMARSSAETPPEPAPD